MSVSLEFSCPICYEPYDTPKALPCQHTLCQRCIDLCSQGEIISCPECRSVHAIPFEGFPTNIALQRILESLRVRDTLANEETPLLIENIGGRQEAPANPPEFVDASTPLLQNDVDDGDNGCNCRCSDCRPQCRECCSYTVEGIFQVAYSLRSGARGLLTEVLRRYRHCIFRAAVVFLVITLARIIAGSVKLNSACPMEHQVALYLFVKSWIAILYWVVLLVLSKTTEIDEIMYNICFEIYVVTEGMFSFIWLITGTVWSSGSYSEMTLVCPKFIPGWGRAFLNFSVVLNIVDWTGVVVFVIFVGCVGCCNRDEINWYDRDNQDTIW